MAERRAEIIAANEARFRAFNERLGTGIDFGRVEIVCECGAASCHAPLVIDTDDYRRVRSDPRRFVVAVGHEKPDVEAIVDAQGDRVIVEKPPEVAHVVERDARGGADEQLEETLTYVWTSSDELELGDAGQDGRRLRVAHGLVMPLAAHQGRRVRLTVRDGTVVGWSPAGD